MVQWQLQDAKNRFSEVVQRAKREGPQTVTLRGERAAVILSSADYDRLTQARPSLVDDLLAGPLFDDEPRAGHRETRQASEPRSHFLMYLIDTNIVSEARRGTKEAVSWLRSVDPLSVFLSVVTLGEVMRGIALKQKSGSEGRGPPN